MALSRLLPLLLLIGLAIPSESLAAKKAKKEAAAKPAPKKKAAKLVGGALPPLPASTGATLHFEGDAAEAAVYANAVSSAADTTAAAGTAPQVASWKISNWRAQMVEDIRQLKFRKTRIGKKLQSNQRQEFAVAVHYLEGVYQSASQFLRLSEQALVEFNEAFPPDRDGETALQPPAGARRVHLYLDKTVGLDQASDAFLERSTKGRKESIVRVQD
jgi:hypothetical protein